MSMAVKIISRGASVHYQTLSPMTKSLFQKAIVQSGTAGASWSINTIEDARAATLKFARKVGCNSEESAEVAKCLRSKTADEILQAALNNTVSTDHMTVVSGAALY